MIGNPIKHLLTAGLPAVFLAVWAALVWLLARTVEYLRPAMSVGDPASLAVGLILLPWLFYLAQSPFYLPRRATGRPMFIGECLFNAPLVFLPFPSGAKIETGPALEVLTTPEERAELLSAAEARLRSFNATARLTRLLEARSPLDLILTRLSGRSPVVAWPAGLIYMIMGPARQFMRLGGFIFFLIWRAWDDPGPEDETTAYKKAVAFDLGTRLAEMKSGELVDEAVRMQRLLAALRRVYNDPDYGGQADAPEDDASKSLYGKPYLYSRYYGLYLDIPVTLAADTPAEMYDGGPEEDPAVFYPPELREEVERAALLKARRERLLNVLSQWPEDGLVRIDGRLRPAWRLRAKALDCQAEIDYLNRRMAAHHRRCRSSHLAAAVKRGCGWPEALRNLAGLIHLAEHKHRALTLAVDGFLHESGLESIPIRPAVISSGDQTEESLNPDLFLYATIDRLQTRLAQLELPPELEVRENPAMADELPPPGALNRDSWSGRWEPLIINLFKVLDDLRDKALTLLLTLENALESEDVPAQPPVAAFEVPDDDSTVKPAPPERERSRSEAERLRVSFGRSAAALLIMALLLWQGQTVGHSRVTVYNGLGRAVEVTAGDQSLRLAPFGHGFLSLWPNRAYEITASIDGRQLESFRQRLAPVPASEIYNVAGVAPLMEWWSPRQTEEAGRFLGRPRWLLTRAEVLFRKPPSERSRKLVLSGYGDASPAEMLSSFDSQPVRDELIRLHAAWDDPDTPWFLDWQALLFDKPYAVPILLERLREPDYLERRIDALTP